jgi:hypothetical protein
MPEPGEANRVPDFWEVTMGDEGAAEREIRIREKAYSLWEAEGCPDGRADEFWERARKLIGMEGTGGADVPPLAIDPVTDVSDEKAALREEFDRVRDRVSDLGDSKTPLAGADAAAPVPAAPGQARG